MSEYAHKTFQTLLIAVAAVLIVFLFIGKKESPAPLAVQIQREVVPAGRDTVVIHNNTVVYPASGVAVAQGAGITTAQVDSIFREYFARVTYDTTLSDSSAKEHLSIEIERNRLKKLVRSLEVYQTTKTITLQPVQSNEFYGGLFTIPTPTKPAFGPMVSYHDRRGFVLSAGKDLNSSGIYGSFQIKFGK